MLINNSSTGSFGIIKDSIRRILVLNGLVSTDVELLDPVKCFAPLMFRISQVHSTVSIYEHAREDLASILSAALGNNWRMMSLVFVGKTET